MVEKYKMKQQPSKTKINLPKFTHFLKPHTFHPSLLSFLIHKNFFEIFLKHAFYLLKNFGVECLFISIYGLLRVIFLFKNLANILQQNQADKKNFVMILRNTILQLLGEIMILSILGTVQLVYKMTYWDHVHQIFNGVFITELVKLSCLYFGILSLILFDIFEQNK